MNIFFVHSNPQMAARMLCNAHVRSQIKESVQMLATAHYMYGNDDCVVEPPTHRHHPATKWVMHNRANYDWLYQHLAELMAEYKLRWGNPNWREKYLSLLEMTPQGIDYRHHKPTVPPAIVPDDLKPKVNSQWDAVVDAYRAYYNRDKRHLHFWMEGRKPEWITDPDAPVEPEKTEVTLAVP